MDVSDCGWKLGLVKTAMVDGDLRAQPVQRGHDVRAYEVGAADDENSHTSGSRAIGPTSS
jgi:hypothetical protein